MPKYTDNLNQFPARSYLVIPYSVSVSLNRTNEIQLFILKNGVIIDIISYVPFTKFSHAIQNFCWYSLVTIIYSAPSLDGGKKNFWLFFYNIFATSCEQLYHSLVKRYTKYLRKAKLNLCSWKFMRTEKEALIPLIVKIRVWLRLNGSDPGAKKPRSESQ